MASELTRVEAEALAQEKGGAAVFEDDKFYVAVEGKVVEAGSLRAAACDDCGHDGCEDCAVCESCEEDKAKASAVGARVEADGRLGTVVAKLDTIYGDTIAVRFDGDGEVESFYPEQVSLSSEEPVEYESAIAELLADHEAHEALAGETLEEVRAKLASAGALKLRARALVTDDKLPLSDRVKLDSVISATAVDEADLTEDEFLLASAQDRPERHYDRFEIDASIGGGAIGRDDGSWIGVVDDDFTDVQDQIEAQAAMQKAAAVEPEPGEDPEALSDEELDAIPDEYLLLP